MLRPLLAGLMAVALLCGFKGSVLSTPDYSGFDDIVHLGNSTTEWGLTASGGFGMDPTVDIQTPKAYEFRSAKYLSPSTWSTVLAGPFFDINNTTPNGNPTGGIGSDLAFMRDQYIPNLLAAGRAVRTTTQAVGGTDTGTAGYWQVATSGVCWSDATAGLGVKTAVTRINGALAQRSTNQLKYILLSLGQNAANAGTLQAAETADLVALVSCLRSSIVDFSGNPVGDVPVLFQGLVPAWVAATPSNAGVDAALKNICSSIAKCGYTDMTGITGQNSGGVAYHLTAADQRSMALRWYTASQNLSP